MPQVGEEMADRARDVVAVAPVFWERLNADPVGIAPDELAHAERELAGPLLDDLGRFLWQRVQQRENEFRAAHEIEVRRIRRDIGSFGGEISRLFFVAKAFQKLREQLLSPRRGLRAVVFDRIGDPTQQVAREDRPSEIARQDGNSDRERARHAADNPATESERRTLVVHHHASNPTSLPFACCNRTAA